MTHRAGNSSRHVAIAGASGLVGTCLLRGLLDDPTVAQVHAVGRRTLGIRHPKLVEHLVTFPTVSLPSPLHEAYLALGTTIRQAGSRPAFRAVDFDANLAVARAACQAGARRIGLVSAMGANARSTVFYSRVKGELEEALKALSTDALVIARPSFILGDRAALGQPGRAAEGVGIRVARALRPVLPRDYRAVEDRAIARALLEQVPAASGVVVLPSGELQRHAAANHGMGA